MGVRIINADVLDGLRQLDDESVHCVVTSPPYWGLRDYGADGQIGLEESPHAFVTRLVDVFREVRRVLRKDGTCWLNLGDSYAGGGRGDGSITAKQKSNIGSLGFGPQKAPAGFKPKDLIGIPWRVAIALQDDGWWLRCDIIWNKPNPMPESVTDRPTKAHEYVFLLTKSDRYHYDADAIKEPAVATDLGDYDGGPQRLADGTNSNQGRNYRTGKNELTPDRRRNGFNARWDASEADGTVPLTRNKRSVWTVPTAPFADAHFATFPPNLIEPMIMAGCPVGGTVLDPFSGAGTTALVADRLQRSAIGIELNPEYAAMSQRRIDGDRGGLLDLMEGAA